MQPHILLIALDSVGVDPLGHNRPDSVYSESRLLFPQDKTGDIIPITNAPMPGALVETDVVGDQERGAIECALTYTSIFSGKSAVAQHGLMRGLGLNESLLQKLIDCDNLFRHFHRPCLANALFPAHLSFFGTSFVQDLLPHYDRPAIEAGLQFRREPVRLKGRDKHAFAELFTMAEINQNIFVYAARQAKVSLRTWHHARNREALTSSMTHELESDLNVSFFDQEPLPIHTPGEAAEILVELVRQHDFTFYKYQISDLISHTGKVELARQVFELIEEFVERILQLVDRDKTRVIVTSDHGHLEQVASSHAHPKTNVPTWFFGPDAEEAVDRMRTPEGIFGWCVNGNAACSGTNDLGK